VAARTLAAGVPGGVADGVGAGLGPAVVAVEVEPKLPLIPRGCS
jgi:hypothetical protein